MSALVALVVSQACLFPCALSFTASSLAVLSVLRPKVILLVGAAGVGKSSVLNALLGWHPRAGPAQVGAGCVSVTVRLQEFEGPWFGSAQNPRITLVDTPGQFLSILSCCPSEVPCKRF